MVKKIILDDPDCERYISRWELVKNDINFIKNIFSFLIIINKKKKSEIYRFKQFVIKMVLLLNILFLLNIIVDSMVPWEIFPLFFPFSKFDLLIMK